MSEAAEAVEVTDAVDVYFRSVAVMGTIVTVQIVGHGADQRARDERATRVDAAFRWFLAIEAGCSRFDEHSEVSRLASRVGTPVPVSDMLFEAARFALAVAEETDGAFDPTVGHRMAAMGFDSEHRTGRRAQTALDGTEGVTYRDVRLDSELKTITLLRPLMLDLGAVAKGLAVDMAARELQPFGDFAVDAGGDLYFSGSNPLGQRWTVGIRHPRDEHDLLQTITMRDAAVCTSGDYARRAAAQHARPSSHHILDPRSGTPASLLSSVTVVAPTALVADALATAAFVLGPVEGVRLLERHGVDGLLVTPALERFVAAGALHCFQ